jgi:hypothetical protein
MAGSVAKSLGEGQAPAAPSKFVRKHPKDETSPCYIEPSIVDSMGLGGRKFFSTGDSVVHFLDVGYLRTFTPLGAT